MPQRWIKSTAQVLLAAVMAYAGVAHFRSPAPFVSIVPNYLPYPLLLVYISGFFEVAGAVGLVIPKLRRWAAIGLVALYIAVFPANINMAVHNIPIGGHSFAGWELWLRLPLQLVLIAWAWWCGNIGRPSAGIRHRGGE